jgi:glutamate synthase (NADPH/NADH) small chain
MARDDGFLVWPREPAPKREAAERVADFGEFIEPLSAAALTEQSGRCMDCGIPFCHQGCPLGNAIPDFNDAVYRGRHRAAHQILEGTNNFPEFTGRVCPAPCEAACTLAINDDPVTIEQVEKEIIERAFAEGWVQPRPPEVRSGQHVAVVGSGPAGLAAAAQLNRAGHRVTVYEKADQIGGLLRYGIPDFKLEKWVIDRRVALMAAEGIEFRCGVNVGEAPAEGVGAPPASKAPHHAATQVMTWARLRAGHDAVVVCVGAERPRMLSGMPGAELAGVVMAMTYLTAQNRTVAAREGRAGGNPEPHAAVPAHLNAKDRHVIILGGGDTGSDCLGTALRQGAASVRQVELFPAPPEARSAQNPWPQWPMVFRTSSSQGEGGQRDFGWQTTALEGKDGHITGLRAQPVTVENGRLTPVPDVAEEVWPVDLLLLAMGFVGPEVSGLIDELGVASGPGGTVQVDATSHATKAPGVFAAGDAVKGASLVVWAISQGREAARGVDAWLSAQTSRLPTRGTDLAFGGR